MSLKPCFLFCLSLLSVLFGCRQSPVSVRPVNLRSEYLYEPIGIGTSAPRFTWEYAGEEKGFSPSRYEIRVGTEPDDLQPYTPHTSFLPHTRYYWNVSVWDARGRRCAPSEVATFETAKFASSDWTGTWITDRNDKHFEPAPLFRKTFTLAKNVRQARAYVAAAGYYELFINGKRVGENYLDPGYTHFDKRILYTTYDITSLLQSGENAAAAVLGNGWYNEQSVAVWNFHEARWRDRPRLLCELRLTFADGTTLTIPSDSTWRTATGPYTYNNLYSGDCYDARLEEKGWKEAAFDDAHWLAAVPAVSPTVQLSAQQMPGIRVTEEVKPTAVKAFGDRLYVYTFPKNMSGFCRLNVKGKPGTQLTLRYGELLKPDGRLEQGNIDVYYHPVNPGEAFQTDTYILNGEGEECFTPSFTYHGFRYVEVESTQPVALTADNLTALFLHTAVAPVGRFSCSDSLLNKVWAATMQAYRSNLHSIPTDCPQREKNGWTADAHVAIDLGLLGFDGITLYEKWMDDLIDNQRDSIGDISGIIPSSGWGYGDWPGPVWDAVMFIIPDALYHYYGETRSIEKLYPTLQRYLRYLASKETDGWLTFGLGDWVYWKSTTDNTYTSTAYYYLDYKLMARFAALTGRDPAPYQAKADELKARINARFFDPSTGRYAEGTQTAQALALYLGLVPEGKENLVASLLHEKVAANDYFLDFGLLGSKTVPAMLTRYGYVEDAMRMVTKTEAPSWGYWVQTQGYTTLAETWTLSPEFHDASLNHVFMGDVAAWMMNALAGINYDPDRPGFRHIRFTPHFVKGLDWASGEYHSVAGRIYSRWQRQGDRVHLTVVVPSGCTATVEAGGKNLEIASGCHEWSFPEEK